MNPVPPVSPRAVKMNPIDRLAHTIEDLSATRSGLLECADGLADAKLSEHADHLSVVADELGEILREMLADPSATSAPRERRPTGGAFPLPAPTACVPIRSGVDHFVFHEKHVSDAIVLSAEEAREEISFACGAPVIRVEDALLPLIYLSDVLGSIRGDGDGTLTILPVHVREQTYGLVVDEVGRSVEVSCLPSPRVLRGVKTYAGACQLKNGALALVLDPEGVAVSGGMAVGPNAPSQLPPPIRMPAE